MRKDYIDITLLVDRSGSMSSIHGDVIGGLNTFVKQQRELPGTATLNVYQFDHEYEKVIENQDIREVKEFTNKDFSPRGSTNIYDAIGKTINSRGQYFASLKEEDRPEKVILVIFTDGYHNVHGEFTRERVFEMVRHHEEKYSWEVIYLGADQDAMKEGGTVGVNSFKTMSLEKTSGGITKGLLNASAYTGNYRSGKAGW